MNRYQPGVAEVAARPSSASAGIPPGRHYDALPAVRARRVAGGDALNAPRENANARLHARFIVGINARSLERA